MCVCVCVCVCYSVEDHFYNRAYYLIDEALTWAEARDRCSEGDAGFLAEAKNVEQFDFLRGMYDKYLAQGGDVIGAWIDGKYDPDRKAWPCNSYFDFDAYYDDPCLKTMPLSTGEPSIVDTMRCVIVWWQKTDGVANYRCDAKLPAICATYR